MSKRLPPVSSSPGVHRRVSASAAPEMPPGAVAPACPHHRRPRPMRPMGGSRSASGDALVLYACTDPHCRYREGWGRDPRTGEPRRLIRGFDEGRR